MFLKKEDLVVVISGKEKGARGKILRVLKDKGKVVVEGVNRLKHHEKPGGKNEKGGIVDKEAPLPMCKVMLVNPRTGKPVRAVRRATPEGKKIRVEKKTGNPVD